MRFAPPRPTRPSRARLGSGVGRSSRRSVYLGFDVERAEDRRSWKRVIKERVAIPTLTNRRSPAEGGSPRSPHQRCRRSRGASCGNSRRACRARLPIGPRIARLMRAGRGHERRRDRAGGLPDARVRPTGRAPLLGHERGPTWPPVLSDSVDLLVSAPCRARTLAPQCCPIPPAPVQGPYGVLARAVAARRSGALPSVTMLVPSRRGVASRR